MMSSALATTRVDQGERPIANTAGSMYVAALGIGTLFLTIESERLLAIGVDSSFSLTLLPVHLVAFLCVALLAAAYCLAPALFRSRMLVELVIAVLYSASKLVTLEQSIVPTDSAVFFLSDTLSAVGEALLLFIWFRELASYGARFAARTFAYGVIVLAALNILTLLLRDEAVRSVIALLPIISLGCLFYQQKALLRGRSTRPASAPSPTSTLDTASGQAPSPSSQPSPSFPSEQLLFTTKATTGKGRMVIAGGFYLSLACLALVFGQILYKWVLLQDGSVVSLVVQVGTAFGSAAAGLCALALLRYSWNRRGIELCEILLFGITVMALWLSVFTEKTWVFLFVALLNTVQKLTFLLILLSPFIIAARRDRLRPLWFAYGAFTIGKLASATLLGLMTDQLYVVCSTVVLLLLLVSNVTVALVDGPVERRDAPPPHRHRPRRCLFVPSPPVPPPLPLPSQIRSIPHHGALPLTDRLPERAPLPARGQAPSSAIPPTRTGLKAASCTAPVPRLPRSTRLPNARAKSFSCWLAEGQLST